MTHSTNGAQNGPRSLLLYPYYDKLNCLEADNETDSEVVSGALHRRYSIVGVLHMASLQETIINTNIYKYGNNQQLITRQKYH